MQKWIKVFYLFLLILLIAPNSVVACLKIKDPKAQLACEYSRISKLDNQLNAIYGKLESELAKKDFADFRYTQIAWLHYRDKDCGVDSKNTKSRNWLDAYRNNSRVLSCLAHNTELRLRHLPEILKSYKGGSHSNDICTAYISAIKKRYDLTWVKAREMPHVDVDGRIIKAKNKFHLNLKGKSPIALKSPDLYSGRVFVKYFRIKHDPYGGLIVHYPGSRIEPGETYVFEKNGNQYRTITATRTSYWSNNIRFRNKLYFLTYDGEPAHRTVTGVTISSHKNGSITSDCSISVEPGKYVTKLSPSCKNKKICNLIAVDSHWLDISLRYEFLGDVNPEQNKDYQSIPIEGKDLGDYSEVTRSYVDIDNDGVKEFIAIAYAPYRQPHSIWIFKKTGNKYICMSWQGKSNIYQVPRLLHSGGSGTFIASDGKKNYVIQRTVNYNILEYTTYGSSYVFTIYLTEKNKTRKIGDVFIDKPSIIERN